MTENVFQLTPEQLKNELDSIIVEVIELISPSVKFTKTTYDNEIYENLAPLFNERRLEEFKSFFKKSNNGFINQKIKKHQKIDDDFNSETILLAYYLCTSRARTLPTVWPIDLKPLQHVYSDMGIAPSWATV